MERITIGFMLVISGLLLMWLSVFLMLICGC